MDSSILSFFLLFCISGGWKDYELGYIGKKA